MLIVSLFELILENWKEKERQSEEKERLRCTWTHGRGLMGLIGWIILGFCFSRSKVKNYWTIYLSENQ